MVADDKRPHRSFEIVVEQARRPIRTAQHDSVNIGPIACFDGRSEIAVGQIGWRTQAILIMLGASDIGPDHRIPHLIQHQTGIKIC
ncbi:MAG: hypothetical protein K2Z25_10530 [Beijerinckiaceae bacterium]|nr:hypothetical protein [Beijerinckiaceae bacterium]